MYNNKPWPWPGDTYEDKAKRVGQSYRGLVQSIAQGRCDDPAGDLHRLDEHWKELGQAWIIPRYVEMDYDEWLSAADIVVAFAHLKTLTEGQIRNWAYHKRKGRDGIIEQPDHDGRPTYNVGDVMSFIVRQRRKVKQRTP